MKKENITDKGKIFTFFKALIIGVVATLISMLLFSGAILLFEVDRSFAAPFATVSLAVGTFLASFYSAGKIGNRGYLVGLIIGAIVFAVVTLISLIVNKNGLTTNTLFHFIIIILSSLIGGILGVNKSKNKKYI